jgi:hypothetical protein
VPSTGSADAGRWTDRENDGRGDRAGDSKELGRFRLIDAESGHHDIAIKPALFEVHGKHRALDETQIAPFRVLLSLGQDHLLVIQMTDDGFYLDLQELSGP